jgi:hypothetical protein
MYQFVIRVAMGRMSQSRQAGRVVSEHYTTVSMVRTIEEVLDLPPLGLHDAMAQPMSEVFDP